jgi:hypothetical protein
MRRMILVFLLAIGFFHSFANVSSAQVPAPSITVNSPTAKAMETDEPSIMLRPVSVLRQREPHLKSGLARH